MKPVVFLCALALAFLPGCSDDPGQPSSGNAAELTLALGGSSTVPGTGIQVTFTEVLEDSRCPVDVTCFHAGNGQVLITAQAGEEDSRLVLNTTQGARTAEFGGRRFELVALAPEPDTRRAPPPDYHATLRVSGK